jgi:biotin carboxylase
MKQKLAIIGADPSQGLLIKKAQEMNIHTICFGLEAGSTCKDMCDEFHVISIIDKEAVYKVCKELEIDGIISIAFDLAMPTINYVAEKLGLVGNSMETTLYSVNKAAMREVLKKHNLPIPKFHISKGLDDKHSLKYPFMVKAVDSCAARGVTIVNNFDEYKIAYKDSLNYSKQVILEEYFEGRQFSVEFLSNNGKHEFIGLTEEFYTDDFVECNSLQPGRLEANLLEELKVLVKSILDAIDYKNGASHTEVRVNDKGEFCIIELAGRMGANRAELVEIAYGIDFLKALINLVLGKKYQITRDEKSTFAHLKLIKDNRELDLLKKLEQAGELEYFRIKEEIDKTVKVVDMSKTWGYFIKKEDTLDKCLEYINY